MKVMQGEGSDPNWVLVEGDELVAVRWWNGARMLCTTFLTAKEIARLYEKDRKQVANERYGPIATCDHNWIVEGQADHHFTCSKCGGIKPPCST